MTPIAAGSVVVAAASLIFVEFEAARLKLGVCESAVAPVGPGNSPTNVVIAWEDGTRTTYAASADALLQVAPPATPSLLSSYAALNPAALSVNQAGRYGGIVVAHFAFALPDGTDQPEIVLLRTSAGLTALPTPAISLDPNR
jgi:hypothetical protein